MDILSPTLTIGTNLHGYQITEILGEGSFGITYKAHDPKLNRFVVIKEYMPKGLVSRQGDSSVAPHSTSAADSYRWGLESFLKDAQTLASFHHPNIVSILDFFEDNGTAYLVMPFLEGEALVGRLSRCPGGIMPEGVAELRSVLMKADEQAISADTPPNVPLPHVPPTVAPSKSFSSIMLIIVLCLTAGGYFLWPTPQNALWAQTTSKAEKDDAKTADSYRQAAEQGNADAQFNLGLCYYDGLGVEQDAKEAVKWYRKAAEQGLADAQFNLGWCYQNGRGVGKDEKEAMKWYRKAAEQGNKDAQKKLGGDSFVGKYDQSFEDGDFSYFGTIEIKKDEAGYYMDASSSNSHLATCGFGARFNGKIVAGNKVIFTFVDPYTELSELPTITVKFGPQGMLVKDISGYYGQYCGVRGSFGTGEYEKKIE